MDIIMLRESGVKDTAHTLFPGKIYPAFHGRCNLFICQMLFQTIEYERPSRRFECVPCNMSVLSYEISETRRGIRCIICNAVLLKYLGINPYAVNFRFQDLEFMIRTDPVLYAVRDLPFLLQTI
jgi:hypothetical protein